MNREIVFRGRGLASNGWYYGSLIQTELLRVPEIVYDSVACYKIQVKNVGQWTGLNDKNGKMIFEDDILKSTFSQHSCDMVVRYGDIPNQDKYVETHIGFYIEIKNDHPFDWDEWCRNDLKHWAEDSEVIGNLWDTPELWEKEE